MSRNKKSHFRWVERGFLADLHALKTQFRLAFQLYMSRIAELRRSSGLGLIAPFLSILVHVSLLGSVMSLVFQEKIEEFIPFFSISICIWQAISTSISESANSNEKTAQYISFPHISGYIIHLINTFELFTSLALKTLAGLIVIALVNVSILGQANYVGFLFGILLVAFVMFSWALPISYIFDKYRVLRGFLPQIIFAIYLVTPILWDPSRLDSHRWLVDLNPVFHVIEVARAPLLSGRLPPLSILVVLGLSVLGLFLSGLFYKKNRDLVIYRWIA